MKEKIMGFLKQFRVVVDVGLIVWNFKHQFGNPNGYGLKVKLGLTVVSPGDKES